MKYGLHSDIKDSFPRYRLLLENNSDFIRWQGLTRNILLFEIYFIGWIDTIDMAMARC